MKKKLIALLMAASMVAGTGTVAMAEEQITDLVTYVTDTSLLVPNLMIRNSNGTSSAITGNYIEGFCEMDSKGNLIPAAAESWETTDGALTWTFHLRDGLKWVNTDGEVMADVVAQDWVTYLEIVLNYWKNDSVNTTMPILTIEGAEDYYNYTKDMEEEEAMALDTTKFLEMVGIETPDDKTVTYTCITNCTYFDSLSGAACLFPLSQKFVDQFEGDYDEMFSTTDIWSNGPYIPSEYVEKNSLVLTKNAEYWDTESSMFDTVTYLVVSDDTLAYTLYENGEIDRVTLPASTLKTIYEDENHKYHDYLTETKQGKSAYSIHFNYVKFTEEGTMDEEWNAAVGNEAFRKAFYYGTNWLDYLKYKNFITPLSCDLSTYTINNLLSFSDGTDYTDRVKELIGLTNDGENPAKYDAAKAEDYKAQAIEELTAQGVEFPIEMVYHYKAGDQASESEAVIIKQLIETSLGIDFVTVELDTYVDSWTGEVINNQLQCFAINGWGADYGDIMNFLAQETTGNDQSMYATGWSHANDLEEGEVFELFQQYTDMVEAADAVVDDMDERYETFAQAEAFLIDHALVIPLYTKINYQLTRINEYTTPTAMYGVLGSKWKNVETSVEAYTTDQYSALKAEFDGQ